MSSIINISATTINSLNEIKNNNIWQGQASTFFVEEFEFIRYSIEEFQ